MYGFRGLFFARPCLENIKFKKNYNVSINIISLGIQAQDMGKNLKTERKNRLFGKKQLKT